MPNHDFILKIGAQTIAVQAQVDDYGTVYDYEIENMDQEFIDLLERMYLPMRRLHKDGNECMYDAKLVSSDFDPESGELKMVAHLTQIHVSFRRVVLAAAAVAASRRAVTINFQDAEVIRHATR